MAYFIQHEIAKDRIAGMHDQATFDRIVRAARRARREQRRAGGQPMPGPGGLAHRALAALRTGRLTRRPQPEPAAVRFSRRPAHLASGPKADREEVAWRSS